MASGPLIGGRVRNRQRAASEDKHSDWAITVATNVTIPSDAMQSARFQAMDRVATAIQNALMDPAVLERVIVFRYPDGVYRPAPERFSELDSTFVDISGEIGTQKRNIHAHGTFQVKHRSNIRLDQKELKRQLFTYLSQKFPMKGLPHVRLVLLRDEKEAWEKYQEKQQRRLEERQRQLVQSMMGM